MRNQINVAFLVAVILTTILMIQAFAGAPSPLEWQKSYYRLEKKQQEQVLNYDHDMANLMNQVKDLQVFNQELLEENASLRSNPEKLYIERVVVKEKSPNVFITWLCGVGLFCAGVLLH